MARVWCGVDLGSTNVKVVAVDEGGRVRSRVSRPTPRLPDGGSDAEALFRFVERLVVLASEAGHTVAGVCVAGVGEDGLLVSRERRPLGPVLPWFDARRADAVPDLPSDVFRYGTAVAAARTVTAWAWLAREKPVAVGAARWWVALADYPALRWTGRAVMSDTLAARTAAWDRLLGSWDPDRVEPFLGSVSVLPVVVPAGTVLGELRSETLHEAGVLEPGALVVAGGQDHAVAAGLVHRQDPGAVLDSMGTAEVVARTLSPTAAPPDSADLSPPVVPPGTTALRVVELDRNLRWARETSPAVSSAIDTLLMGAEPPHVPLRPSFVPGSQGGGNPHWRSDPCDADPVALAHDVLTALAAEGAAAVHALGPDARTYAAGGWTASPGWMRLKDHSLGRPHRILDEPQLTARAAAHLALAATGVTPPPVPSREPHPHLVRHT